MADGGKELGVGQKWEAASRAIRSFVHQLIPMFAGRSSLLKNIVDIFKFRNSCKVSGMRLFNYWWNFFLLIFIFFILTFCDLTL